MNMMEAAQLAYTPAGLEKAILKAFGPDARFYTCSADTLTPREIIEHLQDSGKLADVSGGSAQPLLRASHRCDDGGCH